MGVKDFLRFEKKKVILPIILVILLAFVLILNATYSEAVKRDTHQITESALSVLKFAVYNATYNGTDESIENLLVSTTLRAERTKEKLTDIFALTAISYGSEYTLNTFGANFCADTIIGANQKTCVATELDLIVPSEVLRLVYCASQFTSFYQNEFSTGLLYPDNTDREKAILFIESERSRTIFNEFEGCGYFIGTLLDQEKLNSIVSNSNIVVPFLASIQWQPPPPKIRLLSIFDIVTFSIIVAAVGYIVSCFVIFVHRKNVLYKKGRKVYLIIFVITVLIFLFVSLDFRYWALKYWDLRLLAIISTVLAYGITTVLWRIYGGGTEEDRIIKKVGKLKRKR